MTSHPTKPPTETQSARNALKQGLSVSIPEGRDLDRLLNYEGAIEPQFYKALSELERRQRLRRGDAVPAPVNVDLNINPPARG